MSLYYFFVSLFYTLLFYFAILSEYPQVLMLLKFLFLRDDEHYLKFREFENDK